MKHYDINVSELATGHYIADVYPLKQVGAFRSPVTEHGALVSVILTADEGYGTEDDGWYGTDSLDTMPPRLWDAMYPTIDRLRSA